MDGIPGLNNGIFQCILRFETITFCNGVADRVYRDFRSENTEGVFPSLSSR